MHSALIYCTYSYSSTFYILHYIFFYIKNLNIWKCVMKYGREQTHIAGMKVFAWQLMDASVAIVS